MQVPSLQMLEPRLLMSSSQIEGDVVGASDQIVGFDCDTSGYVISDGEGALSDATPTGTSYLLHEQHGGWWSDAEKSPTNSEDDLMCWAAAASNVLAWTGWGTVNGMTNSDQIFAYMQDHWTDQGGLMAYGWDWWFDGSNPSQGWSGWSQVDVAGGNFWPGENLYDYYYSNSSDDQALPAIDQYLRAGRGVSIGIYGPGGHAITVWGFNHNPSNPSEYYGIWVTDSDDYKSQTNAPDALRYYEVQYDAGRWYLQNYYGSNSWYIGVVQGLARRGDAPTGDEYEPDNDITAATSIATDGTAQTHSIHTGTDIDWYSFTLTNRSQVTIQTSGISGDTRMWLYGSAGESDLIEFNDDGGSGYFSLIDRAGDNALDAGTYFVKIDEYGNNNTIDSYDISVQADGTSEFDLNGDVLTVNGTSANDEFRFIAGDDVLTVRLNATTAYYNVGTVAQVIFSGGGGTDNAVMTSGSGEDIATFGPNECEMVGTGYTVTVHDARIIAIYGDSDDTAVFEDSAGNDRFYSLPDYALMYGVGFSNRAIGFANTYAYASTGYDVARLYDSTGDDTYYGRPDSGRMLGGGRDGYAAGFDRCYAFSRGGNDTVAFYDSAGDDRYYGIGAYSIFLGGDYFHYAANFSNVYAYATRGGYDLARFYDSAGDDQLYLLTTYSRMIGTGFNNYAEGFDRSYGFSRYGNDTARFYDSADNDTFFATAAYARMTSAEGYYIYAAGFGTTYAYSVAGGTDVAKFYDSAGDDTFVAADTHCVMSGSGFYNYALGFGAATAYSVYGGHDVARLYDSAGDDTLTLEPDAARLRGEQFNNGVQNFDTVTAYSSTGTDVMDLIGSAEALTYDLNTSGAWS